MSDPVLSLILIVIFFFIATAAAWFRTLDATMMEETRLSTIAGIVAGVLMRFVTFVPHFIATGMILTAAALYVRLTGRESEPADGMTLGAVTGAAASLPLVFNGHAELLRFSECVLAGAASGYGITLGLTQVQAKVRQLLVDVVTVAAAIVLASIPVLAATWLPVSNRMIAIGTATLVPLIVIATVFVQWPAVRDELQREAELGVIFDEDVAATAHPLRRLGRGSWYDRGAHRQFVRLANTIALRKRQQRRRPPELARVYELEVIKLRMQLQEMVRVDRAMRLRAEQQQQPAR